MSTGNDGELFRATVEITEAFEKSNIKSSAARVDGESVVEADFSTKNAGIVKLLFISSNDGSDVEIRAFKVVSAVPEDRRGKVLGAINACNDSYRYAKFILDEDGDINVDYDIPAEAGNVGEIAIEIAARFTQIIDEVYPDLMKAIWG